jgi:hypothetical protein
MKVLLKSPIPSSTTKTIATGCGQLHWQQYSILPVITRPSIDKQRRDPTAELLACAIIWTCTVQSFARNGVLPKSLEDCPLPVCPACLYGKAKRRPTQTKRKNSINPVGQVREPGDCVSVGIPVSKTKGWLTTRRYQYACVFVDHFSDFTYEATAESHGIRDKYYH